MDSRALGLCTGGRGECKAESRNKDRQIRHEVVISGGRMIPSMGVIGVMDGAIVSLCSCTGGEDDKGREFMGTLQ